MTQLGELTKQQEEILAKIREIEESCEGIENEHNANRVKELNLEQVQLSAQKAEVSAKLSELESKLSGISSEIARLSGTGIDRILEAIKKQRWYFFKNKPKVLMDRDTGLLWPNLDYYNIYMNDNDIAYSFEEDFSFVKKYNFDGYKSWEWPSVTEFRKMSQDRTFPFIKKASDESWYAIKEGCYFTVRDADNIDCDNFEVNRSEEQCCLPKSDTLVKNTDYENNVLPNNSVYTEKERLQFTLDLFVQNELWPIFNDDEITQLYNKIYFEKPKLLEQLQELQTQIAGMQNVTLLSSEFDYTALLSKYNIAAIDASIIKYYQAIQQWIDELMEKLDYYEKKKEDTLNDAAEIILPLAKEYESSAALTDKENKLLEKRQRKIRNLLSLELNSTKSKLLAVKAQADNLEERINQIDNGMCAIKKLAKLEKEERTSFSFITENTAKVIRNALLKMEYFEQNRQFVTNAVNICLSWTENYQTFKTTMREEFNQTYAQEGISEEVWSQWYQEWNRIRYAIEKRLQPILERELKAIIPTEKADEITVAEQIIAELYLYKTNIDEFFLKKRGKMYQKQVIEANNKEQEKIEVETYLSQYLSEFQKALETITSNCVKIADRLYIQKWMNHLLEKKVDRVMEEDKKLLMGSFINLLEKKVDKMTEDNTSSFGGQ